jgi:hypothetical protein
MVNMRGKKQYFYRRKYEESYITEGYFANVSNVGAAVIGNRCSRILCGVRVIAEAWKSQRFTAGVKYAPCDSACRKKSQI